MLIFYIRHGDPTYNPDALTPLGHRQAEAIGRRLAAHGMDLIFSSTSNRAYETAVPLSEMLKKPVEQLDWANESHAWKNLSDLNDGGHRTWYNAIPKYKDLFHSDEVRDMKWLWYDHPAFADKPQTKEYMLRSEVCIDEWFQRFGYTHDRVNHSWSCEQPVAERVALFAHGGFADVFMSNVMDIPYPLFCSTHSMCHSGMTVISFGKGPKVYPTIMQYSADGHLYADRLPTAYNNGIYL